MERLVSTLRIVERDNGPSGLKLGHVVMTMPASASDTALVLQMLRLQVEWIEGHFPSCVPSLVEKFHESDTP